MPLVEKGPAETKRSAANGGSVSANRLESVEDSALPAAARVGVRVLIVDDDHTLRESCASILKNEGYEITLCARGDEALRLLRPRRPALSFRATRGISARPFEPRQAHRRVEMLRCAQHDRTVGCGVPRQASPSARVEQADLPAIPLSPKS